MIRIASCSLEHVTRFPAGALSMKLAALREFEQHRINTGPALS